MRLFGTGGACRLNHASQQPQSASHTSWGVQIKELFELDLQQELTPSPPEALLSGLLTELRRLHWCRCEPSTCLRALRTSS